MTVIPEYCLGFSMHFLYFCGPSVIIHGFAVFRACAYFCGIVYVPVDGCCVIQPLLLCCDRVFVITRDVTVVMAQCVISE